MGKSHYLHIFWLAVWTPLKNMKVKWDYLLLPIYGKSSKSWFQTTNQNPISIHNYGKIHHFQWVNPTICIYSGWWFEPHWKIWSQMGLLLPIYGKSSKSWFQTTNQNPISIHNYGKIHHFQWVIPLSAYMGFWLVVWTPLKNMKVKWDYCSQYMESHKSHGSKPPTRIPFPFITMERSTIFNG